MKTFLHTLCAVLVVGLAYWAYRENYATQAALRQTERLHDEIRTAHSRLAVLRAEWAFLNRPERLRELAELNYDRLQLLTLRPDQFGRIDQVAYPWPPDELERSGAIEIVSRNVEARP